jgi:hypothetical protein
MKADSRPQLKKRPRAGFVSPGTCLGCGQKAGYQVVRVTRATEFRGESLPILYECSVCAHCGDEVLTPFQMEARLRETVAAFQRRKGLMTASEVSERRRRLGFGSQQELAAAHPAIAIATLKRIEAGQHAQDPSTDFILRRAFDELEARRFLEATIALLRGPLPELTRNETLKTASGSGRVTMMPSGDWSTGFRLLWGAPLTVTADLSALTSTKLSSREEAFAC